MQRKSYSAAEIQEAKAYYETMNESQREKLVETILLGLPGSLEAYSLQELREAISAYREIDTAGLRENLLTFIKEIAPVAEESGVLLGIHPDDPPWSLLGLPRVVRNQKDIEYILKGYDSPANGLTFCTGSLGADIKNDLAAMAEKFIDRINFVHLRNVTRNEVGDFLEDNHLEGDVDMFSVIKTLVCEQRRRRESKLKGARLPMRPDHGHLMLPDHSREGVYPGYSLLGRMRGLAELRGMELAIQRSLGI